MEDGDPLDNNKSSSDDSDGPALDEEDAAASPPEANGLGLQVANGHAHASQQSAAEYAQRAGRPPDAALVVAEVAAQTEHVAQTQGDSSAGVDAFVEDEPDPAKARALESSLWEVASLRNHYCPQACHHPVYKLCLAQPTLLHSHLYRLMSVVF